MSYMTDRIDEFIRDRVSVCGSLNRADLVDHFGFNVVSASRHIGRFMGSFPGYLVYDLSGKCYRRVVSDV